MRRILAIDPGAGGGIAWHDADGIVQAIPMPDGMTGAIDALARISAEVANIHAVMEKVGAYVPGNSGPAAAKFARHCGNVEAALYCLYIPTTEVAPSVWMRGIGVPPKMDKGDRKRRIRDDMARLYPHLRVTLKTADALGILTWAVNKTGDAK